MFAGRDMLEKRRSDKAGATQLPAYGRFLQADPLGYEDGMNMYAYVGNDPVNKTDPTGLGACDFASQPTEGQVAGCVAYNQVNQARVTYGGGLMSDMMLAALESQIASSVMWQSESSRREIAAWNAYQDSSHQCVVSANCGAGTRAENRVQSATLKALLNDKDVKLEMTKAWSMSFGHSGRTEVHEHGFWIKQTGSDYQAGEMREAIVGRPGSISLIGPAGGTIWFHTHPFIGGFPGLSPGDRGIARNRHVLVIAVSHTGWSEMDRR